METEGFWSKVAAGPEHECWPWVGVLDADGYGRYGKRRAHRVAYEIMREPIPEGLTIDHLCRMRMSLLSNHQGLRDFMRRTAKANTSGTTNVSRTTPANEHNERNPSGWDADYIRWLEDPDITIGKALRLELAARLKELIAKPA